MSLAAMQAAWAVALTDPAFRTALREAPSVALAGRPLSPAEVAALRALASEGFSTAAAIWESGRLRAALAAFPLTTNVLGVRVDQLAEAFSAEYPLGDSRPPPVGRVAEAEAAATFLSERIRTGELEPSWLSALLRLEMEGYRLMSSATARRDADAAAAANASSSAAPVSSFNADLLVAFSGYHVVVAHFDIAILNAAVAVKAGKMPDAIEATTTTVVLVLRPGGAGVAVLRASQEVESLLESCDGTRSVAEILATHGNDARLLLEKLIAKGAVGLRRGDADAPVSSAWDHAITAGLVVELRRIHPKDAGPELFFHVAEAPARRGGARTPRALSGIGVARDEEVSRCAAAGETVERECALVSLPSGALLRATGQGAAALGRVFDLDAFGLESPPYITAVARSNRTTGEIDWCWAHSLRGDDCVLVPAGLVHLSLVGKHPNEYVSELTTTGVACGLTRASASVAALYEVIERDAIALWWHANIDAIPLNDDELVPQLSTWFARVGYEVAAYRLLTDISLPVAAVLASDPARYPASVLGVACRATLNDAIERATCEAAQVLVSLRRSGPDTSAYASRYATVEGAALVRARLARTAERKPRPVPDLPEGPSRRMQAVAEIIGLAGLEAFAVDLSTPRASQAGFSVVRALVPGALEPLTGRGAGRLPARRIASVRAELGFEPAAALNLLPAPLG